MTIDALASECRLRLRFLADYKAELDGRRSVTSSARATPETSFRDRVDLVWQSRDQGTRAFRETPT